MRIFAGLIAAPLLCLSPAAAQDEWREFSLSSGLEYTSGDYGAAADTNILYIPLTAKYETARFQLRATGSWLQIEGPGSVLGGPESGIVVGPGAGGVVTESGLGDIIVAGTYNLYPEAGSNLPYFEITAKVKLPTADETRGLGTGKTDFTIQLDAFKAFGPVTPFASVGYRFRGDPDGFELENSLLASGGATVKVSPQMSIGAAYDYREAATLFAEDASEVSPFVVVKPADNWAITGYGVFGFSDGSPDTGGGLQLRRAF